MAGNENKCQTTQKLQTMRVQAEKTQSNMLTGENDRSLSQNNIKKKEKRNPVYARGWT